MYLCQVVRGLVKFVDVTDAVEFTAQMIYDQLFPNVVRPLVEQTVLLTCHETLFDLWHFLQDRSMYDTFPLLQKLAVHCNRETGIGFFAIGVKYEEYR